MISASVGKASSAWLRAGFSLLALGSVASVQATEGGGSSYSMGSENYGTGSMPKPGLYGVIYSSHYEADSKLGNDGKKLPIDFNLISNAISPRFIWVTDYKVLGGQLALHTVLPLVDLNVKLNGRSQQQRGLGDITFGPGLGFRITEKLRSILGLDFVAPTGEYHRDDLAKLGRNYWVARPVAAFSYIDAAGWNADAKVMYDFNTKNQATHYTSGQEFHVDYSAGWGLGAGWVVGVGGYFYQQITDDRESGNRVENSKGRALAIGPSIKYTSAKGWYMTAKWQQESEVRNRTEGNAYWLKFAVPF